MITTTVHHAEIPGPLATDAATATASAGPCGLCQHTIRRGQRYAILVPDSHAAHLSCIALHAARPSPEQRSSQARMPATPPAGQLDTVRTSGHGDGLRLTKPSQARYPAETTGLPGNR